MKKNIILVLILTLLISLAYQLEEVSKPKQVKEVENSQRILEDSLTVSNISFPAVKVELESKTGQWVIPKMNYPASTKAVNSIITILKGLSFSSAVSSESERQYFQSNEIAFSISGRGKKVELILGDLSQVSGNFYLKVNNKLFIANDHSHFSDTYTDELDLKYKRYLRLVKMLKLVGSDLIDKRLFWRVNLSQTKFVKINNKRNRWFQLDFDRESTMPEPFQSVRKKNLKKYFNFYLKQVLIKKIVQTKKNVFTNLVSEVDFGGSKTSTSIKLFAGLNGQYGKFVRISGDDRVYEIEDEGSEIFYSNVQDYWWKKFPINVDFKSINSFEYELSLDHKNFEKFSIVDIAKFKIKILSPEVNSINNNMMNFVFNLMLNLVDFKEASYITQLDSKDSITLSPNSISLKLFEVLYNISIHDGSVQVLDLTHQLKYVFNYNTGQFQTESLRRIFTVKKK